jgi:4-hydroxybenzoate polyprenyltransferase
MNRAVAAVRVWAEMVKLSHSVFALPFALAAAFLAGQHLEGRGRPYWGQLGLVIVCMVAGRSVAMTFNRIVDARLDARNPRTAGRPLPARRLSLAAAHAMLIVSAITFGIGCLGFHVFYKNTWPVVLSGPVLVYVCAYSFTKRFTPWSHVYLGTAVAFSPVAAWIAIHPASLGWDAVVLLLAVSCWIAGFDIIYACQDIEADRQEGLFSLPARVGAGRALWVARIAHLLAIGCLVFLCLHAQLGLPSAVGVVLAAGLLAVENALVRPTDLRRAALAFSLNSFVSVVCGGSMILDVLLRS